MAHVMNIGVALVEDDAIFSFSSVEFGLCVAVDDQQTLVVRRESDVMYLIEIRPVVSFAKLGSAVEKLT